MKQTFKRVSRHLYRRQYENATGDWATLYYARFVCRLRRKRRLFALGTDLKAAKDELKKLEAKDVDRHDFDSDRHRVETKKERDGKREPFTFDEWAERYPTFDDVKRKRSLADDLRMIKLHLKPFFGQCLLTEIEREALCRYIDRRCNQTLMRGKERRSKKTVSRGTISNELSLLRRMLSIARREGYGAANTSFEDLIVRSEKKPRALSTDEQKKVLGVYAKWMARLAEFAAETCLSEGDLLRLTEDEIETELGVIIPEGGRRKTQVEQCSPLTERARAVLDEIRAEKRRGTIVPNVNGLIFTRADGRPITKDMIQTQVEKAITTTGVKKFVFHNYRATALTEWARRGYPVDIAMKAAGHSSQQVRDRYLDLRKEDIAATFRTSTHSQLATEMATKKEERRRAGRK